MNEKPKPWYQSVTLYGAIMVLIATVCQVTGLTTISLEEQEAISNTAANVATLISNLVGSFLVIWGRIRAKSQIR